MLDIEKSRRLITAKEGGAQSIWREYIWRVCKHTHKRARTCTCRLRERTISESSFYFQANSSEQKALSVVWWEVMAPAVSRLWCTAAFLAGRPHGEWFLMAGPSLGYRLSTRSRIHRLIKIIVTSKGSDGRYFTADRVRQCSRIARASIEKTMSTSVCTNLVGTKHALLACTCHGGTDSPDG